MRAFMLGGLLAFLAAPPIASAQPKLPPPKGGGFFDGGLGLNYHSRHLNIAAFLGGPLPNGGWYGFASPWLAPPPAGPPPFFFGPNPFFLPPPQPIVIVPRVVVQQPIVQVKAEEPAGPPKIANPDRFIVIQPGQANNVAEKKLFEKPKEVDLGVRPAELPLAPVRAGNALADADRQLADGRAAFGKGEFGRALEHFRRATVIAPAESAGYSLLSQAQFAVGKYDEAVTSIASGMQLRRDWPMSRFDPRGLYKGNAATFDFHLRNLRAALDASPDDPRLLFLLGVELWFDGKRDEAKPLLDKAARLARDPAAIWPFLGK
jgi:hypothetical protein